MTPLRYWNSVVETDPLLTEAPPPMSTSSTVRINTCDVDDNAMEAAIVNVPVPVLKVVADALVVTLSESTMPPIV